MQIKRVFAYPMIVIALALLVLILLAAMVVPTFEDIFNDFDMDLPGVTVMIVNFSRLLRFHPLGLAGLLMGVGAAIYLGLKILREWILPGRLFGVFLNGNSQQVAEMAVFVRRLTEAINAGMPLSDALQLVGRESRHRWLRREASVLADAIASHPSDSTHCLKKSSLPATVSYALQAGPGGAPHIPLLQALAESYSARVGDRFNLATGFLPQLAILVVGFAVGIVVLALFIPLVELVNGLTG
jgi:type II secretory pathway component PulF